MSFINYNAKEIHCKIVYYGPSLGGKTTNVRWIFEKTAKDQGRTLTELHANTERTIFFDFLPLFVGEIRGFQTRFHLYSVPGQVVYDASRKLVLKGLDGIVFVADSQKERMEENLEALKNLETNLRQQGHDFTDIPIVIQYNKRDLENATQLAELRTSLNKYNWPEYEAVAAEGKGVMESLTAISKMIINSLKGGSN